MADFSLIVKPLHKATLKSITSTKMQLGRSSSRSLLPLGIELLKRLDLTDGKQPGENRDTLVKNTGAPPTPSRNK
jgi:hypothetical protein